MLQWAGAATQCRCTVGVRHVQSRTTEGKPFVVVYPQGFDCSDDAIITDREGARTAGTRSNAVFFGEAGGPGRHST